MTEENPPTPRTLSDALHRRVDPMGLRADVQRRIIADLPQKTQSPNSVFRPAYALGVVVIFGLIAGLLRLALSPELPPTGKESVFTCVTVVYPEGYSPQNWIQRTVHVHYLNPPSGYINVVAHNTNPKPARHEH